MLDATALSGIIDADLERGIVRARAGTSLDELMHWLIPRGWFLVTPGTRFVTVGGAIASDIHGKGHHVDGTFGNKVRSFRLLTGTGDILDVDRETSPEIFWATTGGMGLTGIILDATFELIPTETRFIRVDEERCPDLDAMFQAMEESDSAYRYSVAWIDCGARGKHLGRGILGRGNHATLDEVPKSKRALAHRFAPHQLAITPPIMPSGLINAWTVKAFNELWYRKTRVSHRDAIQDIGLFFHPLDMIDEWSRAYGSRGFVQYQFVVPFGAERHGPSHHRGARQRTVAVVPRGPQTVRRGEPRAVVVPDTRLDPRGRHSGQRRELARTFDRFDDMVLNVGGRVYLAKDARTRPENLERMYPRLPEWREVRHRLDPDRRIVSDLSRRLGL